MSRKSFNPPKKIPIEISIGSMNKLKYLAKYHRTSKRKALEFLIEAQHRRDKGKVKCCQRLHPVLREIKESEPLFYSIDFNADLVHYIGFLKDLFLISEEIFFWEEGLFKKNMAVYSVFDLKKIQYILIGYYPFEAIKVKNPNWKNGRSIKKEMIKTGREIAILRDSGDITLRELIRRPPIIHRTDQEILEEVLSW